MKATFKTANAGNAAIETQVWTLDGDAAREAAGERKMKDREQLEWLTGCVLALLGSGEHYEAFQRDCAAYFAAAENTDLHARIRTTAEAIRSLQETAAALHGLAQECMRDDQRLGGVGEDAACTCDLYLQGCRAFFDINHADFVNLIIRSARSAAICDAHSRALS